MKEETFEKGLSTGESGVSAVAVPFPSQNGNNSRSTKIEAPDEIKSKDEAGWPHIVVAMLGLYVVIGGLISFVGWTADLPRLSDWTNEGISIQPNTTVAVMSAGMVLLLLVTGYRRAAVVPALLVLFIGVISVFQIASGIDLGINTFLMFGREWGRVGVLMPGLMGPPGAVSWFLIGNALLLLSVFSRWDNDGITARARFAAAILAIISLSISMLSLIGYLYEAHSLYRIPNLTVIALQTSTFIFAVSLGIILSVQETGPLRLFIENSPAGIMVRRIVPAIFILPVAMGLLRLAGQQADYYDVEFGNAARTMVEIVLLLALLWWTGSAVSRQARRAAEHKRELEHLADAVPQVVWVADTKGKVHYYNDRAVAFGGIKKFGPDAYDWQPGIHKDDLESTIQAWHQAVSENRVYEHEHRVLMADGSYRWHLSRAVPVTGGDGKTQSWYGTATDIHELKNAGDKISESEQRFVRFMQNLPGLAWIKDRQGRYIYANEAAQRAFRMPAAKLYGKTDAEVFPPETAAAFTENDRRALASESGIQTVEALRDENGDLRFSVISKFPIAVIGEQASLIGGMAIDITEQKQAQENQEFLFKIAEKIRIGRNPEKLLADISEAVGKYLGVHRCLFNEIDLDADTAAVRSDYCRNNESVSGTHRLSDYSSIAGKSLNVGQTVINHDTKIDPRTSDYFEKTYGPTGELSYVAVPMLRNGKWIATLWCSDDKPRNWSTTEVALLENIAERTWAAVERLRAETTRARLASIVESSDDAIISKDLNGIIKSWNRGAERIFGYGAEEVIGKSITILIPHDRADEEPVILDRIRRGESIDHYETIRRRKDGTLLDISLTVSPIFNADGMIIGASKVARDITERKQAEKKLRESEERFSKAFKASPLTVTISSLDTGRLVEVNDTFVTATGYSREEAIGKTTLELGLWKNPEDREAEMKLVLQNGELQNVEYSFLTKHGEEIIGLLSAEKIEIGGRPFALTVIQDITDRKKASEALGKSEERFRLASYAVQSMIYDWDIVNDRIERTAELVNLLGFDPNEEGIATNNWWRGRLHPDDAEDAIKTVDEAISEGREKFEEEYRIRHRDGHYVFVCDTGLLIRDENGTVVRCVGSVADITRRKKAEEKLQESYETFFNLIQSAPFGVYLVDSQFRLAQVSAFSQKVFENVKPLLGRDFAEVLRIVWPEPFATEAINRFRHTLETGEPYHSADTTEQRGDIEDVESYDWLIKRITMPDETFGVVCYFYDMTDRKRAELALRESQKKVEQARDYAEATLRSSPIPLLVLESNLKVVTGNEAFYLKFGVSQAETEGRRVYDLGNGQWKIPKLRELLEDILSKHTWFENFEVTHDFEHIGRRTMLLNARRMKVLNNGPERIILVIEDITKRKEAESALQRYRLLSEKARDIIWLLRPDGEICEVNQAAVDLYGYTREELLGMNIRELRDKSALPEFSEQLKIAAAGNLQFETVHIRKDGTAFPIEVNASGADFGGEHLIMSIVRDISERKQAETALRESQSRFELAQDAGNVGIWDWDAATNQTYWSDTMWRFYGENPKGENPHQAFWSSHLYASDREGVLERLSQVMSSDKNRYHDEFRIFRTDNSVRWIEVIATIERDNAGRPVRMYGVNLDITERKNYEEQIRLSENRLRVITNSVPALISYIDNRERYRVVNHTYSEWFKIPENKIIGRNMQSVLGERAYRTLKPKIDEVLAGRECSFEVTLQYKNAGKRYVHISYVPDVRNSFVHGFYALTNDLTELRKSQEALAFSQQRLGAIIESFTDYAVLSMNCEGIVDTWNVGAEKIFGYSEEEMIGQTADKLFTPEDIARGVPHKEMRKARQTGHAADERWHMRKDGSRFFASGVMKPLYTDKTLVGYAKIATDLTEKRRYAEELQQAHDELEMRVYERTHELAHTNQALLNEVAERKLSEEQRIKLLHKIVTTQEDERQRIARDLHDQLGQRLTALRLKIASLQDLSADNPDIALRFARLQEISEQLDSEVSFLARELRPSALDDLGLVQAISAFVNEWTRHYEIPVEFHSNKLLKPRLNREVETHLYRITQEALNNIVKHAKASHVTLLLERTAENVVLIIEDDGQGFNVVEQNNIHDTGKGLGLVGMRERAALIGGNVEIESMPGHGTTIYVRIPAINAERGK